jgi:quaternary ammonium compound-resistance protein SugE
VSHAFRGGTTVTVTNSLAWLLLLVAGVLEVVWSISMKASAGFTRVPYTVLTVAAAWLSFWLLGLSLKALPVGTAYAVWTGIGAIGAAVLFHEPVTGARVGSIALILLGIVGLRLASS